MRDIPDGPVFSRPEALATGWSDDALFRAVRSGRLTRVRRGYFADASGEVPVAAAIAAARGCSHSVVSHYSAAMIHGLPIVGVAPPGPHLTVPPRTTGDIHPGHLYRARLRRQDATVVDGVPVTSIARTVADLARCSAPRTGTAAVDYVLNQNLASDDELTDVAVACRRWPGARRMTFVFEFADGRAESPLESWSRLVLSDAGLPQPELQTSLLSVGGGFLGRADFYWDQCGVVGESDGRGKYVDRDVLFAEKRRQDRMEDAGLIVVRWTWDDLRADSTALSRRIEAALRRGRARSISSGARQWRTAMTPARLVPPLRGASRSNRTTAGQGLTGSRTSPRRHAG